MSADPPSGPPSFTPGSLKLDSPFAPSAPQRFQLQAPALLQALPATKRYGGWKLQLGDDDRARIWGGKQRPASIEGTAIAHPGGQVTTVGGGDYVERLKRDLEALGFGYFDAVDGKFDVHTECALREFQLYARMHKVACDDSVALGNQTYYENLRSIENTHRYLGPASGVLNDKTASLIVYWLENDWRCPVVIIATLDREGKAAKPLPEKDIRIDKVIYENIWRYDQFTVKKKLSIPARFWAYDVTGHYVLPKARADAETVAAHREDRLRKVGVYYLHKDPPHSEFGGARARLPQDSWAETEVSLENLYGRPWDEEKDEDLRQSFLVIRNVSDQECQGRFDIYNTWDRALVSFGLCHMTMYGLQKSDRKRPGLLSEFSSGTIQDMLFALDEELGHRYYGIFGLHVQKEGGYTACLEDEPRDEAEGSTTWLLRLQAPKPLAKADAEQRTLLEERLNYLKSWHWVYRYQMALRCDFAIQRATARFFVDHYMEKCETESGATAWRRSARSDDRRSSVMCSAPPFSSGCNLGSMTARALKLLEPPVPFEQIERARRASSGLGADRRIRHLLVPTVAPFRTAASLPLSSVRHRDPAAIVLPLRPAPPWSSHSRFERAAAQGFVQPAFTQMLAPAAARSARRLPRSIHVNAYVFRHLDPGILPRETPPSGRRQHALRGGQVSPARHLPRDLRSRDDMAG